MSAAELAVAFILQMAVILAACRLVGTLARRAGTLGAVPSATRPVS
jgi:hypothetical protein